jgi:hypothetical protein
MKWWLLFFISGPLFAQPVSDDPARPVLGKTGQIFVLKFIPKASRLEVALAGKEAASVEPGRLEVFGKVLRQGKEPLQLEIQPAKDHYQVKGDVAPDAQIEIQVKDKKTKKSETLMLNERP